MAAIGVNHVAIGAKDLSESVRFYEEVFGMKQIPTYNFGIPTQYLKAGAQQIHIFQLPEPIPAIQHFAFNVDDFHAVYDRAKELDIFDITILGTSINELPDGSVQMYVRDPAGNLVEIDWPDVTTLDPTRIPELGKLADRIEQTGDNLRATLYHKL